MRFVKQYDVGVYQVCSIDNESKLWCWGYNANGQLGVGDVNVNEFSKTLVSSLGMYCKLALDNI